MPRKTREPFGHRGHPSNPEDVRAGEISDRLSALITKLMESGLADTDQEAVDFVVAHAMVKAYQRGETWANRSSASLTVRNLWWNGRAAKSWSMDAIALTIVDLEEDLFGIRMPLP